MWFGLWDRYCKTPRSPRDDDNWLAWVLLKMGPDGQMEVTKEPIPNAWKPDLSIPYEERYPNRYPGELEYLGLA